jgi:hypothetical protein
MMRLRRDKINYTTEVEPAWLRRCAVEEYADRVSTALERKPGEDVQGAVSRFGGRVILSEIEDWLTQPNSIFVHGMNDFDILIGSFTSSRRDQFTLAHELGHYFLHSKQGEIPLIVRRSGENERVEWEANWFAAAFLMPADLFKEKWQEYQSVDEMASVFGVSADAVRVRKKVLLGGSA